MWFVKLQQTSESSPEPRSRLPDQSPKDDGTRMHEQHANARRRIIIQLPQLPAKP